MNTRSPEALLRRSRRRYAPGLASLSWLFVSSVPWAQSSGEVAARPLGYAEVDAALEGVVLLEPNALWRYFVGTEDPAPKLDWGRKDFDDSGWSEGPGPFGFPKTEELGTTIEEIGQGVSTVYLRRILEVPDLALYERVLLELPIDDGYVLFVGGIEEDRLHAGKSDEVIPFGGHASLQRGLDTPPMPVFDLTPTIKDVRTQIALQTLTHAEEAETYGFHPRIWARYAITAEGEKERADTLRARLPDEGSAPLRAYLEGRHLQRLGDAAGAVAHFRAAAELDPLALEPWRRLVECHRATATLEELDAYVQTALEGGDRSPAMLDVWAAFCLDELGRPATDLLALLPVGDDYPKQGLFADAVWAGRGLAAGHALRIDCGAPEDTPSLENGGSGWSRDRCHRAGVATALSGEGVGAAVRTCTRALDELLPVYRIPATPGLYELRLTFEGRAEDGARPGEAALDILVEGARARRFFDPVLAAGEGLATVTLPLRQRDAVLELDLLPRASYLARVAALEFVPVDRERFRDLAQGLVTETGRWSAYALVQLAEARLVDGDELGAFALLEEAERLPDFTPEQSALLGSLRDGLLPRLLSFATADDLFARRTHEAPEILEAVRAQGEDDLRATYLAGRIELAAGRLDSAIGAFEELIGEGVLDPGAWLGMATCLAGSHLNAEAVGLLQEALVQGAELTPELLQTWISLELGLGTDPWELLAKLREHDLPDDLWVVPTSEKAPLTWRYTAIEPPAIVWSRTAFDDAPWEVGPGGFGSGHTVGGSARSFWNSEKLFARYPFRVPNGLLLYPHVDVHANDAADVYMNGTLVSRVGIATRGYVRMSLAKPNIVPGDNLLGLFGFNVRDDSGADVGLVQPLADLAWIADELAEDGIIRLNCGGSGLTTLDGRVWAGDRMHGWALAGGAEDPELDVQGTEDDELFRTYRWFYDDSKSAWYHVPLPNGAYRITLYFAEVDPKKAEPGARTFDVTLETVLVLDDLDVAGTAGFATLATHVFDTRVNDGYLDLLLNDLKNRSFLSALEIEKID